MAKKRSEARAQVQKERVQKEPVEKGQPPKEQAQAAAARVDDLKERLDGSDAGFADMQTRFKHVFKRFDDIDARLAFLDARFSDIVKGLADVTVAVSSMERRLLAGVKASGEPQPAEDVSAAVGRIERAIKDLRRDWQIRGRDDDDV